ncbi:MAG TPA: FtsX-like permease family protein [Acidimicrobiales bacterium]|nr:FtsX-like permease family protein [Acidimicrobiales bacterium]
MTLGAPALVGAIVLVGLAVWAARRWVIKRRTAAAAEGGVPARRAVSRWAWRLFQREWRQQLLVLSLIVVAVAATVVGAAVAIDSTVPASNGFGTAGYMATFSGSGPQFSSELAQIQARYGQTEVIENESRGVPGSVGSYELRAQDPHGPFGGPMLSLLSGHYPTAAGETDLTPSLASDLGLKVGDIWPQGANERPLRVVGLVQNPQNFLDQFALVPPGQLSRPTQVTVLFDAPGVPPQQIGPNVQTPATATPSNPLSPLIIGGGLTMGMLLIGLVSVGGFTVLAQRRLRSFGVLASLGATENNISLVVKANGAVVGIVGATIGAALGLLAWLAYRPTLEATAHRAIPVLAVPWPVVAASMVLAVLAAYFSASRPARAVARVPVLAALSGRPNPPAQVHRSTLPGLACLVAAFLLIGYGQSRDTPGQTGGVPEMILGLALLVPAVILLSPFCLSLLSRLGRVAPVTVRLAWRDLARYRARSGSALAAISLSVLIAVIICVAAAARYANPLDYTGPNLGANQLIVNTAAPVGPGPEGPGPVGPRPVDGGQVGPGGGPAPSASPAAQRKTALAIAAQVGAHEVVELQTTSASLFHIGPGRNWVGPIYVATPEMLAAFHVRPAEVLPDADILSMRPGLAGVAHLQMTDTPGADNGPPAGPVPCTKATCIDRPVIQAVGTLPSGTDAPNTLITQRAIKQLGLTTTTVGWFIEAPQTVNPAQLKSAQLIAAGSGMSVETKDNVPSMSTLINAATLFGIGLALAILAMSIGLVRSETAGDLRILAATGASSWARRTLSAATAGGLALLGAVLGTVAGYVGMAGWVRSNALAGGLSALENVPVANLLVILLGMPAIAVVLGWLIAGRERPATVRRAIE